MRAQKPSMRTFLAFFCLLALSACASAQSRERGEKSIQATREGVVGAAIAPLEDVGLIKPEIPAAIAKIDYPYMLPNATDPCALIGEEIARLDVVLGAEDYNDQGSAQAPVIERGLDEAYDAASGAVIGAVNDLTAIPFRSWVRKASGADKAAKQARRALELGYARRAFLRGYGVGVGCSDILPPPPDPPTPAPPAR